MVPLSPDESIGYDSVDSNTPNLDNKEFSRNKVSDKSISKGNLFSNLHDIFLI